MCSLIAKDGSHHCNHHRNLTWYPLVIKHSNEQVTHFNVNPLYCPELSHITRCVPILLMIFPRNLHFLADFHLWWHLFLPGNVPLAGGGFPWFQSMIYCIPIQMPRRTYADYLRLIYFIYKLSSLICRQLVAGFSLCWFWITSHQPSWNCKDHLRLWPNQRRLAASRLKARNGLTFREGLIPGPPAQRKR